MSEPGAVTEDGNERWTYREIAYNGYRLQRNSVYNLKVAVTIVLKHRNRALKTRQFR